jgi:hypothetical protein
MSAEHGGVDPRSRNQRRSTPQRRGARARLPRNMPTSKSTILVKRVSLITTCPTLRRLEKGYKTEAIGHPLSGVRRKSKGLRTASAIHTAPLIQIACKNVFLLFALVDSYGPP